MEKKIVYVPVGSSRKLSKSTHFSEIKILPLALNFKTDVGDLSIPEILAITGFSTGFASNIFLPDLHLRSKTSARMGFELEADIKCSTSGARIS